MKLTAPQADRLTRAVETAESKTSIELVLTLVPRSRRYLAAPVVAGIATGLVALGLALFLEEPEVDAAFVIPLTGAFGLLAFLGVGLLPVRWLARAVDRRSAVDTQAHAAFSRQGLYRTSGRTGLLVFLSLAEREARLLADRGVVAAVPEDVRSEWQARLTELAGQFDVEALARTLEAMGERAGGHLPRLEGDVDELPNAPVEGQAQ